LLLGGTTIALTEYDLDLLPSLAFKTARLRLSGCVQSALIDADSRLAEDGRNLQTACGKAVESLEYAASESARALIAECAVVLLTTKQ
jgi:hypothetical protein